jgi:tetratricopeptide (TPR) repeat protein
MQSKEAETAYREGKLFKAIELFETIFKKTVHLLGNYYNLGQLLFTNVGKLAPAILNYERALLFDPSDGDIRFNFVILRDRKPLID